ncbi:DegT/DnrJ/EryC1/StrS aminotransferase family protein [bacterium SCSIO 12696]|nr:DegT/DnrJ/EryC1/StrS aminotransferase family protein [bacterium SCSIO 12696]
MADKGVGVVRAPVCNKKPALKTMSNDGLAGKDLRYVESKRVDIEAVKGYLEISCEHNHWSNFGPVSLLLEEYIAELLGLESGLKVVMCANATAAMHALVTLEEVKQGSSQRWGVSSFGFYSCIQGPLQKAAVYDCDEAGLLDLNMVGADSVDALIMTNMFGANRDIEKYHKYANDNNKFLLIDSALAFGSHKHVANECISFHHTKPWGFGEGGCAIVLADDEKLFRSLINFGSGLGSSLSRHAGNGKISDVSCAYILARLRQMEVLSPLYQAEYERIKAIGTALGLQVLGGNVQHPGTPSNVPFISQAPLGDIEHPVLPTARYYQPLENTPVASSIYERILNIPCHPQMATLSDDAIYSSLEGILEKSNG